LLVDEAPQILAALSKQTHLEFLERQTFGKTAAPQIANARYL
jgi:hypothetical protein